MVRHARCWVERQFCGDPQTANASRQIGELISTLPTPLLIDIFAEATACLHVLGNACVTVVPLLLLQVACGIRRCECLEHSLLYSMSLLQASKFHITVTQTSLQSDLLLNKVHSLCVRDGTEQHCCQSLLFAVMQSSYILTCCPTLAKICASTLQ